MDQIHPDVTLTRRTAPGKPSLLAKSAQGATFLIVLQVSSRALTFAVNQLLLRYLSPELLGISTQLDVYSISVLFFAREALRVAIQRQNDTNSDDARREQRRSSSGTSNESYIAAQKTQEVINFSYISMFLGSIFTFVLEWVYLRSLRSNPSILETPYFREALQMYGIAALLELASEPCFVAVQQKSEYKIRAAAESIATVSRCIVACSSAVLVFHLGGNIGALPFALGQCTYALSLLFIYHRSVSPIALRSGFSLIARPICPSTENRIVFSYFSQSLLSLGISLFLQGIIKHVLTQGDMILVSYLASLKDQGIYALASNYGGLIARMVFQPVEESCRNYFGKLLSTVNGKPTKAMIDTGSRSLHSLLRLYLLLSLSAISLGPAIAPLMLELVAGSRWTSTGAGGVLATYCYFVPLLAINGVGEAFVSSIATESELNRQSTWMFAFSMGFATAGFIFLRLLSMGAEGIVWANAINMALRIVWSFNFIRVYLKQNGSRLNLWDLMPQPASLAVGFGAAATLSRMKATFTGEFIDFIQCGTVAGSFLILLAVFERQYLQQCYRLFNGD